MTDWLQSAVVIALPALGGWILKVEERLGHIKHLKETTDRTDQRVEKIYDHLLSQQKELDRR